jgi:hypothetical protein
MYYKSTKLFQDTQPLSLKSHTYVTMMGRMSAGYKFLHSYVIDSYIEGLYFAP